MPFIFFLELLMLDPVISLYFFSLFSVFIAMFSGLKSFKDYSVLASVCIAFFYSIVIGYRPPDFGTDTLAYMHAYDNATGLLGFHVSNTYELGFNIWMSSLKQLGFDFSFFVFVSVFSSLLFIIGYSRLFRVNVYFVVAIVVLSSTALSLYSNGFRQGLSLSFVVGGAYYLYASRYLFFLFFGFLAALFHIVTIPFFMILVSAKILSRLSLGWSLVAFLLASCIIILLQNNIELVLRVFEYLGYSGKAYDRLSVYIEYNSSSRVGVGVFLSGLLVLLSFYVLFKFRKFEFFPVASQVVPLRLLSYNFYICAISLVYYISFSSFGVLARIYSYSIFFEALLIYFVVFYLFKGSRFSDSIVILVLFVSVVAKLLLPLHGSS